MDLKVLKNGLGDAARFWAQLRETGLSEAGCNAIVIADAITSLRSSIRAIAHGDQSGPTGLELVAKEISGLSASVQDTSLP